MKELEVFQAPFHDSLAAHSIEVHKLSHYVEVVLLGESVTISKTGLTGKSDSGLAHQLLCLTNDSMVLTQTMPQRVKVEFMVEDVLLESQ